MENSPHFERIAELLAKLAVGDLAEEDSLFLENWRKESPQNESLYGEVVSGRLLQRKMQFAKENDAALAYDQFRKLRANVKQPAGRRRRALYSLVAVAAAVAVVAVGLNLIVRSSDPKRGMQGNTLAAEEIIPGNARAILRTHDGHSMDISEIEYMAVAEGDRTVSAAGQEAIPGQAGTTDEQVSRFNTIIVPRGGEYTLILADGTRIFLNAESQIRIPIDYGEATREVKMKGEAFFEVASDKHNPFRVETAHGKVTVTGTSFNVRDYDDELIMETTLVSGKVSFGKEGHETAVIPGQQVRHDKASGEDSLIEVDTRLYTSWKDGRFIFEQQRLEDIMHTLARGYDIKVEFENPALKDILFTGNIKKYDEFDAVIQMLMLVDKVSITSDGRQVCIGPKN